MFKFIMKYFAEIFGGMRSLIRGMKVTGYYLLNARKEIITQQYPENRDKLKMFDRFRGEVVLTHDENNEHACTGCTACEIACPNGTIEIISKRVIDEETGKKFFKQMEDINCKPLEPERSCMKRVEESWWN